MMKLMLLMFLVGVSIGQRPQRGSAFIRPPKPMWTLPPTPPQTGTLADCWNPQALSRCAMMMAGKMPKLCSSNSVKPTCHSKDFTKIFQVNGMTKNISLSVSCPNCIPESAINSFCKKKVTNICPIGKKPNPTYKEIAVKIGSRNAGTEFSLCPDCIPKYVPGTCTKAEIKACFTKLANSGSRPRDCGEGERPIKEGCCMSCTPPSVKCTPSTCPAIRVCKMKNITAGRLINEAPLLKNDCCRSCIPDGIKKKIGEKCTRTQFKEYMSTVPVCEFKEKAVADKRANHVCGPSCKRPQSDVSIGDLMKCLRKRSKCDAVTAPGESEPVLPGDKCASCIRKRPTCTCSGSLKKGRGVCVRKNGNPKCVKKIRLAVKLKLKSALKDKIKSLDREETVNLIREFVSRFCERTEEASRCDKYKDWVLDSLNCTKKKNSTSDSSTIEIDLEMAESPETAQGRRLLGSTSQETAKLVEDAIADDDEITDSLQSTMAPEPAPSSSSQSIVSGFIVLMSFIGHLLTVI